MTVPHSDCHCDKCLIKYYNQGLIVEGSTAYAEVQKLLKCRNIENGCNCHEFYNCCDCGGNKCGCNYCFSCNACDECLNE